MRSSKPAPLRGRKTRRAVLIGAGFLAGCWTASIVGNAKRRISRSDDRDLSHGRRGDGDRDGATVPIHERTRRESDQRTSGSYPVSARSHVGFGAGTVCWWSCFVLALFLPLDFFDSIGDLFRSIGNDVKSFVKAAVRVAERDARGWVNDARHWAAEGFDYVGALISNLRRDAGGWIDRLRHDAASWVDAALKWAGNELDRLRHDAASWVDALWHDVVDPLARLVEHEVLDAVHVVEKCWDWLVWLGEHTFDELEDMFSHLEEGFTPGEIEGAFNSTSGRAERWLDDMGRWLGETG